MNNDGFNYQLTDKQNHDVVFKLNSFTNHEQFAEFMRYSHFTMLLIKTGRGEIWRDQSTYPFEADCLICMSLFQPFKIISQGEFEGVLINFHPSFFCLFKHRNEVSCNGVLFNNLYDSPVANLTADESEALFVIAAEMERELKKEPDADIILSYLKIFLTKASRAKKTQQQQVTYYQANDNHLVVNLRVSIEENFKQLHSAADYAKLLYVSTDVLNNLAKRYYRKTLTNLIAERMITEAKRELYLTAKPVKQIAFELGYRDEFYFSRYFKKHVGVSPALFRESVGFNKLQSA